MRPRKDGAPAHAPRQRKLTELFVKRIRAEAAAMNVWDTHQRGLVLRLQPRPSHHRSWKFYYRFRGKPRWLHLGDANQLHLKDARDRAAEAVVTVSKGEDPAAARKAERSAGSFAELADRYLNEYSKKHNKSWKQARWLIEKYVLPRWARLDAKAITRADVRAMMGKIEAPITANQTLAAASAIFSWAIKQDIVITNPCAGVDRNATKSRTRVLSDTEVAQFYRAFDGVGLVAASALKVILLCGARPGEVSRMRREHLVDGWWTMPGEPVQKLGWPGTKNAKDHRLWLSAPVMALIDELTDDDAASGFVFTTGKRGKPVDNLDGSMRTICDSLKIENRAAPHDLRRTFSTAVTRLRFGRDALNRVTNHREGGIADVYDQHEYGDENKKIMEAVATHIMALVEGREAISNVVMGRFNQQE
jgi:integrase